MVVIKKKKYAMGNKDEICTYNNMSKKSTQGNK